MSRESAANRFSADLSASQVADIIDHLGVPAEPPGLRHIEALLTSYVSVVPWESASRIARRRGNASSESCVCWPAEFWSANMDRGLGGTCFESNFAFLAFLTALDYEAYLTVNDMGATRACHAALVVQLQGRAWLVDVGIPIHAPIPLDVRGPTSAASRFHDYTVTPMGNGCFEVTRDRHPKPYLYTLHDKRVTDSEFRDVVIGDYDPEKGLFLDRIIINKVIDGVQHRFCSDEQPWRIASFHAGVRHDVLLDGDVIAGVAAHFGMDRDTLSLAWPRGAPGNG